MRLWRVKRKEAHGVHPLGDVGFVVKESTERLKSNFRHSFMSKLTLLLRLPLHNVRIWNQDSVKVSVTVHGGRGLKVRNAALMKKIIMHLGAA